MSASAIVQIEECFITFFSSYFVVPVMHSSHPQDPKHLPQVETDPKENRIERILRAVRVAAIQVDAFSQRELAPRRSPVILRDVGRPGGDAGSLENAMILSAA